MTSTPSPPPISFKALKIPLVSDLIVLLKASNEFKELQHDNRLIGDYILSVELWQPLVDAIVKIVHECITAKKSVLATRQKLLTRRMEEILVHFVESNCAKVKVELVGLYDLPGHLIGVLRLHATNFIRISKREMCHNITAGGTQVKEIIRYAFVTDMVQLRDMGNMRESSMESLYYITGWLLRAALKAAKQREKVVRDQLLVLVANASYTRELAVKDNSLPTAKVERVENFGGLNYANAIFSRLWRD